MNWLTDCWRCRKPLNEGKSYSARICASCKKDRDTGYGYWAWSQVPHDGPPGLGSCRCDDTMTYAESMAYHRVS